MPGSDGAIETIAGFHHFLRFTIIKTGPSVSFADFRISTSWSLDSGCFTEAADKMDHMIGLPGLPTEAGSLEGQRKCYRRTLWP